MVARTVGWYDYYRDMYPGITGEAVRATVDPLGVHLNTLGTLADDLTGDEQKILETTEGRTLKAMTRTAQVPKDVALRLASNAQFACACTRLFANHIDTFDRAVNGINIRYNAAVAGAKSDIKADKTDETIGALRAEIRAELDPEYGAAKTTVLHAADDVAEMLNGDPSPGEIRTLFRQGLIPLALMSAYFPEVYLSTEDRQAAYKAMIDQTLEKLRAEGLLPEGDPGPLYRRWVENADRNGVSLDTIMEIIRDHDIDPDDFKVLDGLEEIRDPDGKSFFMLPKDISGSDARKAVEMAYLFNAGTDYGSANGGDTDFQETPYSSKELQRILDRQDANNWFSYEQDVGMVSRSGGALAATPNGMLMGLGGDGPVDFFSLNGGTTWGDIFMLNIDDPDDPHEAMKTVVESGKANYVDDDGHQFSGSLDLDRLLHHEERHSQQWADEGYAKFIAKYATESVAVDMKGPWIFKAPIPRAATGEENRFENDAGLSDGGY